MIKAIKTQFPGVEILRPEIHTDIRGCFTKYLSSFIVKEYDFTVKEVFFSSSNKNVIRGMHYQEKPFAQRKLVFCLSGECTDVCVDINFKKPSFGQTFSHKLAPFGDALLIEGDIAHGFIANQDNTVMGYIVDEYYEQTADCGIAWNSIKYDWGVLNPILSRRDQLHKPISSLIKI